MNIPFSQICRDYLALRGESPDLLPVLEDGEESPVLLLADELRVKIHEAAVKATLETPSIYLDEIKSFATSPLFEDGGAIILRLPSDYLKFYSLRMPDWKEAVRTLEPSDSLRSALGANAPPWMICAERPMVTEHRDAVGIFLRVLGSKSESSTKELYYIPLPAFDGDTLTISKAAYHTMLNSLAC